MRAIVQRVTKASVAVEQEVVGSIGLGLLILLGIRKGDAASETGRLAKKIVNLRIFSDRSDKMNLSIKEIGGEILIVSQFTLYADCTHGRRPDFLQAAAGTEAEPLYEQFVGELSMELGKAVATGIFGAKMAIDLTNDGPVTVIIE